ncbi:HTH-type transcriptional activator RhaR [bioreactor metagenome]|uniref:HTH-type transcriptional activator RhaR n=1 Tax=bioreactor metagenome TaxID=1076179 RepID=A0A645GEL9_9ZZZZ
MKQIGFSKENPVISIPFPEKVFCYMKEMSESEMSAQNALYFNGMMQLVLSVMTSEVAIPPVLVSNHRRIMNYMGNQYVTILKSMIENSYSERLPVDTLARRLGFNRSYLTNLFKQHTGMSIKQYILDVRMQQAILRLQMNKLSVQQIALECGFSDALYFSRLFKKRFGVSPSMYCCVIEESDRETNMEMRTNEETT